MHETSPRHARLFELLRQENQRNSVSDAQDPADVDIDPDQAFATKAAETLRRPMAARA